MQKGMFWTGLIITLAGIILFFLSGASPPEIPGIYGSNQIYWIFLTLIGLIITIAGAIKKGSKKGKRAAIELSVGTIVVIVIAVVMLILGMVLTRNIMCGAIGLTGELTNKVQAEINKLFEATGEEVQCIGAGTTVVNMIPGETNFVYCSIRATKQATYSIEATKITSEAPVEEWIQGSKKWTSSVAPGDETPKKILRINIPENAPEGLVTIHLEIKKDNKLILSPDLDFVIKRQGWFRAAIC